MPEAQQKAANPFTHAWVGASAGTGKTKVLTDRILRLMLQGVPFERILCLTFTKAAAAEMAYRLMERLGHWASCEDEVLKQELEALSEDPLKENLLIQARSLFSILLESPSGFRIQTIHSFCQSLLRNFPLEARIQPHFSLLEDQKSQELLSEIQEEVLKTFHQEPEIRQALEILSQQFDPLFFSSLIQEILTRSHGIRGLFHLKSEDFKKNLEKTLGISLKSSSKQLFQEIFETTPSDVLDKAVLILTQGGSEDQKRGGLLKTWLKATSFEERCQGFEKYTDAFLTQKGEIRSRLLSKKLQDAHPDLLDTLQEEAHRLSHAQERLKAFKIAQITWALFVLGQRIFEAYEQRKAVQGLLDYEDLIYKACELLHQPDISPWILYKLDGGLDHILVDEAQDTNALQWLVIKALAEEFFNEYEDAQNSPLPRRTLFVVGDVKQSIYSFQGANPDLFEEMHDLFAQKAAQGEAPWHTLDLDLSFRSVRTILESVDAIFAQPYVRQGVLPSSYALQHKVHRQGDGGRVEVWPLVPVEDEKIASLRLAQAIATRIRNWLQSGALLESKGRSIQPSDILILVQRRGTFMQGLIRELKDCGIPVSGADRLLLLDHIAIEDLMALGHFLLLPEDSFHLACALKSPLFGLLEEDLLALCANRGEQTLWEVLLAHPSYQAVAETLTNLLKRTDFESPFKLYAHVLYAFKGRKKFLERLGPDVLDTLDEFLTLALSYESAFPASLQGFLDWLESHEIEVKRDLAQKDQNLVRVMTVHGSKGLQAPIVFLPDTVRVPRYQDPLLWENPDLFLWNPPKALDIPLTETLRHAHQQKIDEEYRRLLYVALTRAEDRLYVCGWENARNSLKNSWYTMISEGLSPLARETNYDFSKEVPEGWSGLGLEFSHPQEKKPSVTPFSKHSPLGEPSLALVPNWLHQAPLAEEAEEVINPSESLEESHLGVSPSSKEKIERGHLIHKLLEGLPDLPEEARIEHALGYLSSLELTQDLKASIVQEVMTVLKNPSWAAFFAPQSQGEVPLIGFFEGKKYSGQIDRLVVHEKEIWLLEFKTHQVSLDTTDPIPLPILRQLKIYKALLQKIYPHHRIKTFVLWTALPKMVPLADDFEQNLV